MRGVHAFQLVFVCLIVLMGSGCLSSLRDPEKSSSNSSSASTSFHGKASSCKTCHERNRPAETNFLGAETAALGHFSSVDCGACHLPRSETVQEFRYSHELAQPESCVQCHEFQRPSVAVRRFIHSPGTECAICHKSAPGTTWSGGSFDHNPEPTSCRGCHGSMPSGCKDEENVVCFRHDNIPNSPNDQCALCHMNPRTWDPSSAKAAAGAHGVLYPIMGSPACGVCHGP